MDMDFSELFPWEKDDSEEAQRDLYLERAKQVHRIFKQDPDGRQILDDMVKSTIMRPVVCESDSQFAAGIREGMCRVVRSILDQIELAENHEPTEQ